MAELTIREQREQLEHLILNPTATFSDRSLGRKKFEEPCSLRTCFQRDVDRITYSKSFRRLKHKTQVFLQPEGDHYRTRLTHTLEVTRIARTVARALRLNEDLTEAIGLGHDLGHTPFGHAGEKALSELVPGGFAHNLHSRRVVEVLEKDGRGLNLTQEVLDGIECHSGKKHAFTKEGRIVHWADRIGYISHDIDDAIRAGILSEEEIPKELHEALGYSHGQRIDTLVNDLVKTSRETGDITMSPKIGKAMLDLREFMFEHVYRNPVAKGEETKARVILQELYRYYLKDIEKIPESFLQVYSGETAPEIIVCDYIAGMTDGFAVSKFEEIYIPKAWTRI